MNFKYGHTYEDVLMEVLEDRFTYSKNPLAADEFIVHASSFASYPRRHGAPTVCTPMSKASLPFWGYGLIEAWTHRNPANRKWAILGANIRSQYQSVNLSCAKVPLQSSGLDALCSFRIDSRTGTKSIYTRMCLHRHMVEFFLRGKSEEEVQEVVDAIEAVYALKEGKL